jgi:oligopeptide/dipeptide ABC transporter ATP-binding protein
LEIRGLSVSFPGGNSRARAVRELDLSLYEGEIHGLVGESGSGKSLTCRSVLGLSSPPGRIDGGKISFRGGELLGRSEAELAAIRGSEIGMIFQEPGKHLNPSHSIGRQIGETLILHRGMTKGAAAARARELLDFVEIPHPARVARMYPHELSGGMKQRAMIAMAVACEPSLLLADEPVTALDATVRSQILDLLLRLRREMSMAVLLVSHDLGVVQRVADRVSVMYAGKVIETAPAEVLFRDPQHPYSRLLLLSIPVAARRGEKLTTMPGRPPEPANIPTGCSFHPRCPLAEPVCEAELPEARNYRPENPEHRAACHLVPRIIGGEP